MFLSESYLTCSVSQTVVPLDPEEKCSRMEAFPNKNGSYPYSHGPVHPPQKTSWTASEFLGHKKQSLRNMCGGGRKWYSGRLYNDPLLGHGCGAHLTLGGGVLI